MMEEATKYIGYPYVWGGSSPSTSFDCSGYLRLYAVLQKIIAKQKQMHPSRYICFLHILFYFCSKVIPL